MKKIIVKIIICVIGLILIKMDNIGHYDFVTTIGGLFVLQEYFKN